MVGFMYGSSVVSGLEELRKARTRLRSLGLCDCDQCAFEYVGLERLGRAPKAKYEDGTPAED